MADFLMRCLFTMFAEDVWLLPKDSFKNLLVKLRDTPEHFVPMAEELWQKMNTGGFSVSLGLPVLWFNGGLFEDATALPLTRDQLLLLTEAAGSVWREVEPAIFGTLLERALDPVERHKLGGHFTPRDALVIDLFGLTVEEVRERFPEVYQWVAERVKPERDENNRASYRDNWWVFGEPRRDLRPALVGLRRYIVTAGGHLGVGNDPVYSKTTCFEPFPFPFPAATAGQQARIRALGEQLDAHRKARQALHPELTLTGMYNVLEKLWALDRQADTRTESGVEPPAVQSLASRPAQYDTESQRQRDSLDCLRLDAALPDPSGAEPPVALTPKERQIHEQDLVTVLRELHDELDRAVLDAYGWPHDLDGQALLQRLVDLNAARAAEEAAGLVRWLRPEYQNPGGTSAQTGDLGLIMPAVSAAPGAPQGKRPWPKAMAERVQVLRAVLAAEPVPVTVANLAARFSRAPVADLTELLDTLVLLGHVRRRDDGRCEAAR